MKKIGFIDYYISEWHANSYPKWINESNQALGTDYKVAYAWAELEKSPLDNVTTQEWCEKYGGYKAITSSFFPALLSDIIKFYESGVVPFDSRQTLDRMELREALIKAYENDGEWIEV